MLVVVLIIGILAAVAVPQYQKAVLKSRYATIKELVYSIKHAQEIYYLTNNVYSNEFGNLDVDMPTPNEITEEDSRYIYDWGECSITNYHVICANDKIKMELDHYYTYAHITPGLRVCAVVGTEDLSDYRNKVCEEDIRAIRHYIYTGHNVIYWYPI